METFSFCFVILVFFQMYTIETKVIFYNYPMAVKYFFFAQEEDFCAWRCPFFYFRNTFLTYGPYLSGMGRESKCTLSIVFCHLQ